MIRLFQSTTPVGNAANTDEANLLNYSLPAGRLAATGDAIHIEAWVLNGATANNKQTRLYFGGTTIGDSGVLSPNDNWWYVRATVFRTGAATQVALVWSSNVANDADWTSPSGGNLTRTLPEETLSGAVSIRLTGTSPVAGAANDVQLMAVRIVYEAAAT